MREVEVAGTPERRETEADDRHAPHCADAAYDAAVSDVELVFGDERRSYMA